MNRLRMGYNKSVVSGLMSLFCSVLVGCDAKALTLVKDGRANAVVVVPTEAAKGELAAAKLLVDHLKEMSGAELEILSEGQLSADVKDGRVNSPKGVDSYLLVGEGELAGKLGVASDGLSAGGVRLRTVGNAVILIGATDETDPQSASYAVIALLERLGFRYLWPGPLGKIVPKSATVEVPALDYSFSPPIKQREIRWWLIRDDISELVGSGLERLGLDGDKWRETAQNARFTDPDVDWRLWQGLGGDLGVKGTHSGAGTMFATDHLQVLERHPEWLALQADGQRTFIERYRLCKSNPELIKWVSEAVIAYLATNSSRKVISLSPNDGGYASFCMCENCKRLDPPEAPKVNVLIFDKAGQSKRTTIQYPSLTDRMIWYWNQIAANVTKVYPEQRFVIDAYSIFRTAPVRERPHPSLVVRYVGQDKEQWQEWRRSGVQGIYWRPNLFWGAQATSRRLSFITHSMADFFLFAADNGAMATDISSLLGHWALHGLNYYVGARLNWDPHQSRDDIVADYCASAFGAGGDAMRQYFEYAESLGGEEIQSDEQLARLRGYLREADRAVASDLLARERVAFMRKGFNFHHLHTILERLRTAAAAKESYDKGLANRLLSLNYVMMRDIAMNHPLVISAPFIMYRSTGLANLKPIGGRDFRASETVLQKAAGRSLTGYEDSLEELMQVYDIGDEIGAPTGDTPKKPLPEVEEADEEGQAI